MTDDYRNVINNLTNNFSDLIMVLEKHQTETNSRLADIELAVERNNKTLKMIANTILETID